MRWLRTAITCFSLSSLVLAAGCGGRSGILGETDCLDEGTCECRGPEDCPPDQRCVNGFCRLPQDGGNLLEFGEPCSLDIECASGFCIAAAKGDGKVCTRLCTGTCPPDWSCKVRVGSPEVSLCTQHVDRLCGDCSVDGHCNPAFGDYCLDLGGVESCGRDCNYDPCPAGYSCLSVVVEGGTAKQCIPDAGTCACTPATEGLERPCENENPFGTCTGESVCQPGGQWSACSAQEPSLEVCNGRDDDCNGLVDATDPGIDTSGLPSTPAYPACQKGAGGTCAGTWACQEESGAFQWVCTAVDPTEEVCDGRDNDCNGGIDEPFLDEAGRYVSVENCGKCGVDCRTVVTNAATGPGGDVPPGSVECVILGDAPVCVPKTCAPGFYPYPPEQPLQCRPLATPQCRPCTTVNDCSVPQDVCSRLGHDSNKSCLQACGANALYPGCTGQIGVQGCCPDLSICRMLDGAAVCVPAGETCDCDSAHEGMKRSCAVLGDQGAKCEGMETCLITAGDVPLWSECETVGVTDEVCDGKDNDCDGLLDEVFINQKGTGTYDVDEHCGECHLDCTAQWSPTIQHAVGGCAASPTTPPTCAIVACTNDTIGGGGACQLSSDCPVGWSCAPPYYQCMKACSTGSECLGGAVCQGGWCTVPCTTSAQCAEKFGWPSTCSGGVCKTEYKFHDVDKVESNGCECPSSTLLLDDEPDIYPSYPEAGVPYVDRNCDGVDGDVKSALFVWQGTDQSLGTREHPFRTIREAMNAFDASKHKQILVASGQYEEAVVLKAGVGLFGGYAPGFARRDIVGYPTLILGPEPVSTIPNPPQATVNGASIKGKRTVVAGFAIYASDAAEQAAAGEAGRSSYGVHLLDCSDSVVIANNLILGGRGGDGGHGNAGQPGVAGAAGQDGLAAKECTNASCAGQSQPGGAAGTNAMCASGTNGNSGAGSNGSMDPQSYQDPLGLNGRGGTNATYTSAGNPQFAAFCKYDCQIAGDLNGLDASSGGNGTVGAAGVGCGSELGTIVNGFWRGGTATNGANGTVGKGGGGGGAGGCVINTNPPSCTVGQRRGDLGATGGGGGAGGCGGRGGRAGGSGGGSFSVFVAFSASPGAAIPQVAGNILYLGEGGAGGDGAFGGHGGPGGPGGKGGTSAPPAWCAGPGGKGGRGGDGGPGGGAGGGCGGVAFAIAGNFLGGANYETRNVFVQPAGAVGGAGGSGGPSPAGGSANGTPGATGKAGVIHVF